jgi:hypothetical protein
MDAREVRPYTNMSFRSCAFRERFEHGVCARTFARKIAGLLMRVNSENVLDEGLRIGGRGHRMNSKVKVNKTRRIMRVSK